MTLEISEPRLERIGRALLRADGWAGEEADRTGLTADEVFRRARAACTPIPKKPSGAPQKDLVKILNEHYDVPNGPIRSLRSLLARHAVIKAIALTLSERKKLTDEAADKILVASFGKPTKPFEQTSSGKTIPFNTYHLKNMRCAMKRATWRAGPHAVSEAVRDRQEYHAWGERCGDKLLAMLSMGA